jgi:hypothetical protein
MKSVQGVHLNFVSSSEKSVIGGHTRIILNLKRDCARSAHQISWALWGRIYKECIDKAQGVHWSGARSVQGLSFQFCEDIVQEKSRQKLLNTLRKEALKAVHWEGTRSAEELYFELFEKVAKRAHQKVNIKMILASLHRERKVCASEFSELKS